MPLTHLEVLVEEPSTEKALEHLLPRLVGDATFRIYEYGGKQALLGRLPARLRAYRRTLQLGWLVLVLVDLDDDDCHILKRTLERAAAGAGVTTRSRAAGGQFNVLNRIVIEELEAWYFGDWSAVRKACPRVPSTIPSRAPYRDPDATKGGTWEALLRIMQRAGYFANGLNKQQAAQNIAPHMDPARNTSHSFQVLRDALMQAAAA
jgi:hypothetical protein